MKNIIYFFIVFLIFLFSLGSYYSSGKAAEQQVIDKAKANLKDTIYVFDKVPPSPAKETVQENTPIRNYDQQNFLMTYYLVQIGAFKTKEKAEKFARKSMLKIKDKIDITFNPLINLYVVQLNKHYNSHEDAEIVRNELWKMNDFKNAWIVTGLK